MIRKSSRISLLLLAGLSLSACTPQTDNQTESDAALLPYQERPITDDIIYFLLPDRFHNGDVANDTGGIEGGIPDHGFDPTHKGFYHGGDLNGVVEKLDYIQSLGATAIWVTPIYKNKAVQGEGDWMSSGYHGYWITDFMAVDPHLGGNDALKSLVDEAHKRNMKVILDIVTNHTADVIKYRECHDPSYTGDDKQHDGNCAYRDKESFPYTLYKGRPDQPINNGFQGDHAEVQTVENFSNLTRTDYAYTPFTAEGEENIKNPAWLNDPALYHNRGETTFAGENSLYGDFAGLDDVFTEHPRVVEGFIDIFKQWISDYKIDGFRVDTTKHVNDNFWKQFVPPIVEHAKAEGIPNFYVFGEVYDFTPEGLSRFTRDVGLPAVLDFGFAGGVIDVVAKGSATENLANIFAKDTLYGDDTVALELPTFISNHDMGRLAFMMREELGNIEDDEAFKRMRLANALLFFARGVPVLYYGDEQGFVGDGGDQAAREDMFESQVASYNDNDLIATNATTAQTNFDQQHPLYREIQLLSKAYRLSPALRHGTQTVLASEKTSGLFALERTDAETGETVVVAINTAPNTARTLDLGKPAEAIIHTCSQPGDAGELVIPPLDFAVCRIQQN